MSYRNYDVINFNRFFILLKILNIIVSLIPRNVIMTLINQIKSNQIGIS